MQYKSLISIIIIMPLTLEANISTIIKWWVNASYRVHPGHAQPHQSSSISWKGSSIPTSTRQKVGTKSSTEAELVGFSDVLSQVIWTRYFMEAQGYAVKDSIV
jgi:hypothetical protein